MSSNYKVRLRRYNGNDYDVLNLSSENVIMNNGLNIEEEIDDIKDSLKLINKIYPVGSIYFSVSNSINPSAFFIGTEWRKIEEGRFLLSSGANYNVNDRGGEKTHRLTNDELPSHTHGEASPTGSFSMKVNAVGQTPIIWNPSGIVSIDQHQAGYTALGINCSGETIPDVVKITATHTHQVVGENKEHNNMPPYLVVHMWERIR